jgi:undecaprenyl-diphosphatase
VIRSLIDVDARLSARMRIAEKPGAPRKLAIFLAHSGDSWFWGAGLLAVWVFGDAAWKQLAIWFVAGIAITALIVQPTKWLIRRERPEGEWGALYRRADPHSFPSGHAARMAMLVVLGMALGPLWFALLLLVWAPLVALARVAMGVHYLSDVVAGAALGLVIGLALLPVLSYLIPLLPAFVRCANLPDC